LGKCNSALAFVTQLLNRGCDDATTTNFLGGKMTVGTGIILGLLIGALSMLLADWFFYRNRRICTEAEEELRESNGLLMSERDSLKRQVKSFDGQAARVGALEADLDTRTKQYNLLLSDHEAATRRYRDLESRFKSNEVELEELHVGFKEMGLVAGGAAGGAGLLAALRGRMGGQADDANELRAALEARDVEIANLRTELEVRGAETDDLRTQSDGELADLRSTIALRNSELADLHAELAAKDVELGNLRGEMDELNIGLDEMGIAAGGAVGGMGLLAALRSRIGSHDGEVGELQASLNAREAEISDLRAQLDAHATADAELDAVRARLAARDAELAELQAAQSAELETVGELRRQLAERDTELTELHAEVEGLDIDWGKMGLAAGGVAAGGGLLARLRGLGRRVNEQENQITQLSATPEAEPIELNPYVINLQGSLSERDSELETLRGQLAAQSAELSNLRSEVDTHAQSHDELAALRLQLDEREAEVARIRAEASARSAELQHLNVELENRAAMVTEVDTLRTTITNRETEILSLRAQLDSVESELGDVNMSWLAGSGALGAGSAVVAMKSRLNDLEAQVAERDAQILAYQQVASKPDDLTKIWGIGSVIEGKLNDSGIYTFEQLARTEQHEIDAILAGSGSRFRLATPAIRATWQEQARLAAVDDWDDFYLLQSRVRNEKPDDMTRIWGLDSEIERSLATRGIDTYRELEEASYDEMLPELQLAQARYPQYSKREIYGYWVQQSRWAMKDDWGAIESQFTALSTPPEPDDLTKIWGIGAGLEGILNSNGIYTFAQLAEAPEDQLDAIIEKAGRRYRIATRNLHSTWSAQAEMAAADDWEALQVYQDKLSWSDKGNKQ
jgi:predicted flap endonuclease-1-like 5' DNA nuclease